jgi:hypothetical protein
MYSEDNIVWFWLDYFANKERTIKYLSNKMETERYNNYYDSVIKTRQKHNLNKLEEIEKITLDSIEEQSDEVVYSIKQASEYFRLSKSANLHVKPLILYYGMISLSKALMECTFIFKKSDQQHGLGGKPKYLDCQIKQKGFFPRFSACNSYGVGDPEFINTTNYGNILSIIARNVRLTFEDLIFPLRNYLPRDNSIYRRSTDMYEQVFGPYKQIYAIDTVSCYLMITYLLSNLVRYRPVEWIRLIEGRDKNYPKLDWILKPLLEIATIVYPAFILEEFRRYPFS